MRNASSVQLVQCIIKHWLSVMCCGEVARFAMCDGKLCSTTGLTPVSNKQYTSHYNDHQPAQYPCKDLF